MKEENDSFGLFQTVVKGGYCIGCGACAVIEGSPIKIKFDQYSQLQATTDRQLSSSLENKIQAVCPFSNKSLNEDEIGKELYDKVAKYDTKLGYYRTAYAGHVIESTFREKGSSGGMGSWILTELLNKGLIDGIIHIQQNTPSESNERLFRYHLSTNLEDIMKGAKSKYYPIDLAEILLLIKNRPGKYAIVGIPCFIKAVRLLAKQDEVLNDKIKFCIGLVCGHLKSASFAKMFAWQCGISPSKLVSIDFRTKLPNYKANQYGVTASSILNGKAIFITSKPVNELYGTNWGLGFFKYKACDYCDDVVAETADISIGDAWLPQYVKDGKGTNIIIIRNPEIEKIIEAARLEGRLELTVIDGSEVIESQKSGFFHRREGLSYRLLLADKKDQWRPEKRVIASNILDNIAQKKQDYRLLLAQESHKAFVEAIKTGSFSTFVKLMNPMVVEYNKLYQKPIKLKIKGKIKSFTDKIFFLKTN
ncbi:Coenzyme F420 hydrogenase/dehydrogenase, beta subunit C-terminal domain [Spirosoma horti]